LHIPQIGEHLAVGLGSPAAVGIKVGVSTLQTRAQGSTGGVEHLDEPGVAGVQAVLGRHLGGQREEGSGGVQPYDLLHLTLQHRPRVAGGVGSQAVARQGHVAPMEVGGPQLLQRHYDPGHR